MELYTFADKYRLRLKRSEDGSSIIPGKLGHIFDNGDGYFGIIFLGEPDNLRLDNTLRARMRKAESEGFEPFVVCDFEGVFLFDPDDTRLARMARKLVEAPLISRRRGKGRRLTPERARELARNRWTCAIEGHASA